MCLGAQLVRGGHASAGVTAGDGGDTVTVGASSSATSAGEPGQSTAGSGGASAPSCTYTPLPPALAAVLGPGGATPGTWFAISCQGQALNLLNGGITWVPNAVSVLTASPTVSPGLVVAEAVRSLVLPAPAIGLDPPSFSVVNLPTWLWVDTIWRSVSATAVAGTFSATAVATPQSVTWQMGDGATVICDGPGQSYQASVPAARQSTYCSYEYRRSSLGEPSSDGDANDAAFPVTATILWSVSWSAAGTSGGGPLPPLYTSSTVHLRVEQVESIGMES
jgi:hypothetical protein